MVKEARETEPADRSAELTDRSLAAEDGRALASGESGDSVLLATAGSDGRVRGVALHDALFLADFDNWELSEWRARKLCKEQGLDDVVEEVIGDLRTTFHSALLERVRAAERVERELPLVTVEPTLVSEGYVDLAFREPAGWVLVDYKSDLAPSVETIAGYEQQVRAYVRMFRQTGEPVAEACLLFTASGETHPVPLEDRSDAGA